MSDEKKAVAPPLCKICQKRHWNHQPHDFKKSKKRPAHAKG